MTSEEQVEGMSGGEPERSKYSGWTLSNILMWGAATAPYLVLAFFVESGYFSYLEGAGICLATCFLCWIGLALRRAHRRQRK